MSPPLPRMTDLTGLGGIALGLAAMLVLAFGGRRRSRRRIWLELAVTAGLLMVPVGALSVAAYLRGVTGDLSVTTLLMLLWALFGTFGRPADGDRAELGWIQVGLGAAALALYPMALGAGPFDPYRLGYGSPVFLGSLLAIALAAWWVRRPRIAFGLALAVLFWALHGYESTNLWDYLIDPFIAFYALVALAIRGGARAGRAMAATRGGAERGRVRSQS
jgi:hypothetical protein